MTLPLSPNTTYVPGSTPAIKAVDLDDVQTFLSAIYSGVFSIKRMRFDGAGNLVLSPGALLELLAKSDTTPLLAAMNNGGKIRTLIDRNGYLTGFGVTQVVEPWLLAPGASGSPWTTALSTGAAMAVQDPNANYNTPYLLITPSSSAGATNYSLATTRRLFMANAAMNSVVLEFELGLNAAGIGTTSNTSFFVGFDNGVDPLGADAHFAYVYKKNGSANYAVAAVGGGLVGINATSPPTPPSANPNSIPVDRFKFEIQGSASPLGSYQTLLWINDNPVSTVTTALPGVAAMRMIFGSANEGGAPSGGPLAYLGPVRLSYNYLLTPPAL
jgi:hypothetical protein